MTAITLSTRGQLVLPKAIREQLHLKAGDKLDIQVQEDDQVVLRPIRKSLADMAGFLPKPDKPVSLEEME